MWLLRRIGERLLGSVDRLQRAFHRSPPAFRRGAAMLVDALIVIESFAVSLLFRFAGKVDPDFWRMFWPFAVFSALAFVLLLNGNGVYQSILRYTGIYQGVRVLSATAMAAGGLSLTVFCVGPGGFGIMEFNPVPLSVPLMGSVLAYVQLVAVRLYPRVFYEMSLREVGRRTRTAIVGTGEPGVALAGHIWRTAASQTQVVGFVSRSAVEVGRHIEGSPVLGVVDDLEDIIARHGEADPARPGRERPVLPEHGAEARGLLRHGGLRRRCYAFRAHQLRLRDFQATTRLPRSRLQTRPHDGAAGDRGHRQQRPGHPQRRPCGGGLRDEQVHQRLDRQGRKSRQRDGRDQTTGRDGRQGTLLGVPRDDLRLCPLRERARQPRLRRPDLPPADRGRRPSNGHAPRHDPVLHDHPRGGLPDPAGRGHGRGLRHLRPRDGPPSRHHRPRPQDDRDNGRRQRPDKVRGPAPRG